MKGGNFWFMTTDKAAQNISYTSNRRSWNGNAVIHGDSILTMGITGSNHGKHVLQNQGYTVASSAIQISV